MVTTSVLPPPTRKPNRRLRVSLEVGCWPAPDREAWQALFVTGDLFDESGSGAHLARRTRTTLENAYGRWLGFLESTGPHALHELLAARVTRERIVSFAHHLAETNIASSVAVHLRQLRHALRHLAPHESWTRLLTIAKRIEAQARRRSKRERLRTSDELYALGLQLMEEVRAAAERQKGRVTKACALTYRDGLMIALLALAPMRRRNLAGLTLGQTLMRTGESWTILLGTGETKNGQPLEFSLPPTLGQAIDDYLDEFRPALSGSAEHSGLWASAKGVPLTGDAVYNAVCRRTREAFGQPVNLHLFRDGAATFWAVRNPAQVGVVSALLGHQPKITERHYNQANGISAGRKLTDVLTQRLNQLRKSPAPEPRSSSSRPRSS